MESRLETKPGMAKVGLSAGIYMALAYMIGIVIFVAVLKYPEITDSLEKLRIQTEMQGVVFSTNLIMYVLFGPVLVLFLLALKSFFKEKESLLLQFSTVIGFLWAGSLTASGMVANAALAPLTELYRENLSEAVSFWRAIETVDVGIGNGNGEVLGGIMTLGLGVSMLKEKGFSRILGIWGLVTGGVGLLSVAPGFADFAALFGLLQIVWFLWTGLSLLRKNNNQ